MSEETKAAPVSPEAAAQPNANRVFCFVSKREILEADATQVPYLKGEKVWVGKKYIQYKN